MKISPATSTTTTTSGGTAPPLRKQVVYLVRHAEATHNIKEREAVQAARDQGIEDTETARRAVLQDESLLDAPLSDDGYSQVMRASERLHLLDRTKYPPPRLVLVSPLRRVLMTATELFADDSPPPRFVAMEALREKRTGYAADERMPVEVLEKEFPHVDFSNLKSVVDAAADDENPAANNTNNARHPLVVIPKGETNLEVRRRGKQFFEGYLATNCVEEDSIAIVTHKGWLREMRITVKEWVDNKQLEAHFDLDKWYQTIFGNAEIRVADFGWTTDGTNQLVSIVSKSVEHALEEDSDDSSDSNDEEGRRGDNHNKQIVGKKEKIQPSTKPKNNLIEFLKLHWSFCHPGKQQQQQQRSTTTTGSPPR